MAAGISCLRAVSQSCVYLSAAPSGCLQRGAISALALCVGLSLLMSLVLQSWIESAYSKQYNRSDGWPELCIHRNDFLTHYIQQVMLEEITTTGLNVSSIQVHV